MLLDNTPIDSYSSGLWLVAYCIVAEIVDNNYFPFILAPAGSHVMLWLP